MHVLPFVNITPLLNWTSSNYVFLYRKNNWFFKQIQITNTKICSAHATFDVNSISFNKILQYCMFHSITKLWTLSTTTSIYHRSCTINRESLPGSGQPYRRWLVFHSLVVHFSAVLDQFTCFPFTNSCFHASCLWSVRPTLVLLLNRRTECSYVRITVIERPSRIKTVTQFQG